MTIGPEGIHSRYGGPSGGPHKFFEAFLLDRGQIIIRCHYCNVIPPPSWVSEQDALEMEFWTRFV